MAQSISGADGGQQPAQKSRKWLLWGPLSLGMVAAAVYAFTTYYPGAAETSTDSDTSPDDTAAAETVSAEADPDSPHVSVVFESTDGSAFTGSRTTFTVTEVSTGELQLVAVEGTESGASTVVELAPGTYRVDPSGDVQVAPTASYTVRDVSTNEVVVPGLADVSDPSVPVATVQFGLNVQRSPFDLRIDAVSSNSAALVWEPIEGADVAGYDLRMSVGSTPAASRAEGTEVPLDSPTATTALLEGLEPVTEYTATLFATSSAGEELAFRSVSVTTATADPGAPAYALAPNTIVPTDFAALNPQVVGEDLLAITLDASMPRSSQTAIPGVEDATRISGCVVGTPVLVSTEVAGDDAFYGIIGSCQAKPASWRFSTAADADAESTVALLDTGVPLASVVPYLKFRNSSFDPCIITADSEQEAGAGPSAGSPDFCTGVDTDDDGMADTTERALGMDPNDFYDNWEKRGADGGNSSTRPGPVTPVADLQAPNDLTTGPLQVTLLWATGDDLDLTVTDPNGITVSYQDSGTSGGVLDREHGGDTACQSTETNAENLVWAADAPLGVYSISVNNYGGTVESPRSPCSNELQARLQIRINGELVSDKTIDIGTSCPKSNSIELTAQGMVAGPEVLVVACSFDGASATWRTVSALEDVDGSFGPSAGDIIRFYEYPTRIDENGFAADFLPIPHEDCVITKLKDPNFPGPPDLRVEGDSCYASWRDDSDTRFPQNRFDMDNRRYNPRPAPGDEFDFDMLDGIDWGTTWDWIELNGVKLSEDQSPEARKGDQDFLEVVFYFEPQARSWQHQSRTGSTRFSPAASIFDPPKVTCEASGEAQFSPRFGVDKFHDVDAELKYTKFTWDIEAGVTVYVDPLVAVKGAYECGLDLPSAVFQLTTTPVPINLEVAPVVGGGVEGTFELDGPRLALTLGVATDGSVNAGVKTCSAFVFDLPCGLNVDAQANAKPIADFTAEGAEGSVSGEASLGAGVEMTIGVGVKNKLVTAKKGFAITLQPVVGSLEGKASIGVGPESGSDDVAVGDTSDQPSYNFGAPPYDVQQWNAMRDAMAANPQFTDENGVPLVGPANASGCISGLAPMYAPTYGEPKTSGWCQDALCIDTGQPIYTQLGGAINVPQCSSASCYLGGVVVNVTPGPGLTTDCPQDQSGVVAQAAGAAADTTPSESPPEGADTTATTTAAQNSSNLDPGVCLSVAVKASLTVEFRAEFWVLAWGTDERFPLFEDDVTYPGAEYSLGECEDD